MNSPSRAAAFRTPDRARFGKHDDQQRNKRNGRSNPRQDARAEGQAEANAGKRNRAHAGFRILFERAHQAEQQHRHRGGEGRVLRVHEHVAVIERAGREQHQRHQTSHRSTKPAADTPGRDQADDADGRADQPPRFEQSERQHLGGKRGRHVEAAAIFVEIDERQRAVVAKARAVKLEQQLAVLRVGVVVPAEAVIAERQRRDDRDDHEHTYGKSVGSAHCRPTWRCGCRLFGLSGDVYLLAALNMASTCSQFTR